MIPHCPVSKKLRVQVQQSVPGLRQSQDVRVSERDRWACGLSTPPAGGISAVRKGASVLRTFLPPPPSYLPKPRLNKQSAQRPSRTAPPRHRGTANVAEMPSAVSTNHIFLTAHPPSLTCVFLGVLSTANQGQLVSS